MEAVEIGLRLVGAFYLFAGVLAMRAVAMDRMMDQMLAAISLQEQPIREARRRWLWGVSAMAIAMGGAALMVLSLWSVPLFLAGLLTQAIYLLWARKAFVPENPQEEKGRRQTINAATLYGVATGAVVAASWFGLLRPWFEIWTWIVPASALVVLFPLARHLLWRAEPLPGAFDFADAPEDERYGPPPPLRNVRLEPRWGAYPLIDADTGEDRLPDLYMPVELADRIHYWHYAFEASDAGMTLRAVFEDEAHEAQHRREGAAIVEQLRTIFGADHVSGPVYPPDIVYVGPAPEPGDES